VRSIGRKRSPGVGRALAVLATPGSMLRAVGRVTLWCVVGLLLVRGAGDVMAGAEGSVSTAPRVVGPVWPDDEARAFAVDFARAYLTFAQRDPRSYARAVHRLVSPELADSVLPRFARRSTQRVQDAVVARVQRIDARHALVTVAATVTGRSVATYLAVPVARDHRGGLTVYDLPSFAPAPERGQVDVVESQALASDEREAIEDVVTRFMRSFLAGRDDELEYFVPAHARITAVAQPYELVALNAVAQLGAETGPKRTVLATVRARDRRSRAIYALRYRLELLRRDRWYVAAVNTTSKEG
jgi:hypothetical protein